jgi:hypothetical protein
MKGDDAFKFIDGIADCYVLGLKQVYLLFSIPIDLYLFSIWGKSKVNLVYYIVEGL